MAEKCNSRSLVGVLSVIVLCWSLNVLPAAEAIWLTIPSSGTKCVSEEIHNNVVVLADYYIINEDPQHTPTISARVTSPYGNNLHHNENVTHGQFAFTTSEAGNYLACFWLDNHQQQGGTPTLSLDWKIGIAAKDWDSVAKKKRLRQGVELDLKRLEGAVEAIHNNLIYLKEREAEMREVSEKTNARVAWFSIMSVGVCIAASGLQLWHLKHYFQKKKLI